MSINLGDPSQILQYLDGVLSFQLLVPGLYLLISVLFSRILRIPLILSLVAMSVPLLLVFWDLPLQDYLQLKGEQLKIVYGLIVATILLVGFKLGSGIRPSYNFAGQRQSKSTPLSLFVWIIALALGVIYVYPPFRPLISSWPMALGAVVFLFALMAFVMSAFRIIRAALVLTVSLVLLLGIGHNVLANHFPAKIFSSAFLARLDIIPNDIILTQARAKLHQHLLTPPASEAAHVVFLGSAAQRGLLEKGYVERFREQLETTFPNAQARVWDIALPALSLVQNQILLDELLQKAPVDLVVLSGWEFNAEKTPAANNWDISDTQVYARRREAEKLSSIPLVKDLLTSRLLQGLLYSIENQSAAEKISVERVPLGEFERQLEQAVIKIRNNGAEVVFVLEALPRFSVEQPRLNPYYSILRKYSIEQKIPILDLAQIYEATRHQINFRTETSLSDEGEKLIAQHLLKTLSKSSENFPKNAFYRLVTGSEQRPSSQNRWLIPKEELPEEILVRARVPQAGNRYFEIQLIIDDKLVEDRRLKGSEYTMLRLPLDKNTIENEVVEIVIQSVPAPASKADQIGDSQYFVKRPVRLASSTSQVATLNYDSVKIETSHSETVLFGAVDYETGSLLGLKQITIDSSNGSNQKQQEAAAWMRSLDWGTLLMLAHAGNSLFDKVDQELVSAMQYCGIWPQEPNIQKGHQAFVGLGMCALGEKAYEHVYSDRTASISKDSSYLHDLSILEVEDVNLPSRFKRTTHH